MKVFIMNQVTLDGPEEEIMQFNEEIKKYNVQQQSSNVFKFNTRIHRVEEFILNQSLKLPNVTFEIKVFDIENGWAGDSKIKNNKLISSNWVAWYEEESFVEYIKNNQDAFEGCDVLVKKIDLTSEPYITLEVSPTIRTEDFERST